MTFYLSKSWLLLGLVLLAACQEEPRSQAPKTEVFISGGLVQIAGDDPIAPRAAAKTNAPILLPQEGDPSLDTSDPCANNLQSLTGELLFYVSLRSGLPETLEALRPLPGEVKAGVACPKTGKAYVYVPQGLRSPSDLMTFDRKTGKAQEGNMLILYDSVPAHVLTQRLSDGKKEWTEKQTVRLGIVMEPAASNKAVKMYVVPIQQALLDAYLKAN